MKTLLKDYFNDYKIMRKGKVGGSALVAWVITGGFYALMKEGNLTSAYVLGQVAEVLIVLCPLLAIILSVVYHNMHLPKFMHLVPMSVEQKKTYLYQKYECKVAISLLVGVVQCILLYSMYDFSIFHLVVILFEYSVVALLIEPDKHKSKELWKDYELPHLAFWMEMIVAIIMIIISFDAENSTTTFDYVAAGIVAVGQLGMLVKILKNMHKVIEHEAEYCYTL